MRTDIFEEKIQDGVLVVEIIDPKLADVAKPQCRLRVVVPIDAGACLWVAAALEEVKANVEDRAFEVVSAPPIQANFKYL